MACGPGCGWCGACTSAWDGPRPCLHCGDDRCAGECAEYLDGLAEWLEVLPDEELAARAAAA